MRNLIIGFAVAAPLMLVYLWPHSIWAAVGVLAASHALLLYPTLRPNVQWLGPVITAFDAEGKDVWLTIDDGPAGDTPALLDVLDGRGAKATFFIKGDLAAQRPDLLRLILARGHGVANHSQTHPSGSFWCLTPRRIAGEIDSCSATLESITGTRPRWFRAPVGMKNPAVHPLLHRRGMRLIGWSVRGFDSIGTNIERVVERIVPGVRAGSIIVMHQGRSVSVPCISRVVDELQARGYSFVIPSDDRLKTKR